jgi:hypothetical protein
VTDQPYPNQGRIIALLESVREAQEIEITERARIDLERDSALENLSSYSSILAQDAQKFGERLIHLSQPTRFDKLRSHVGFLSHSSPDPVDRILQARRSKSPIINVRTPLLLQGEPQDVDGASLANVVHGWRFSTLAAVDSKTGLVDVHSVSVDDINLERSTGKEAVNRCYIVRIEDEAGVPMANLYDVSEPKGPFPARPRQDLPNEKYILPLGLIRHANRLPDKTILPKSR